MEKFLYDNIRSILEKSVNKNEINTTKKKLIVRVMLNISGTDQKTWKIVPHATLTIATTVNGIPSQIFYETTDSGPVRETSTPNDKKGTFFNVYLATIGNDKKKPFFELTIKTNFESSMGDEKIRHEVFKFIGEMSIKKEKPDVAAEKSLLGELEKIRVQLAGKEKDINYLNAELQKLKREDESQKKEIAALKSTNVKLSEQVNEVNRTNLKHLENSKKTMEMLGALEKDVKDKDKQIKSQADEIRTKDGEIKRLKDKPKEEESTTKSVNPVVSGEKKDAADTVDKQYIDSILSYYGKTNEEGRSKAISQILNLMGAINRNISGNTMFDRVNTISNSLSNPSTSVKVTENVLNTVGKSAQGSKLISNIFGKEEKRLEEKQAAVQQIDFFRERAVSMDKPSGIFVGDVFDMTDRYVEDLLSVCDKLYKEVRDTWWDRADVISYLQSHASIVNIFMKEISRFRDGKKRGKTEFSLKQYLQMVLLLGFVSKRLRTRVDLLKKLGHAPKIIEDKIFRIGVQDETNPKSLYVYLRNVFRTKPVSKTKDQVATDSRYDGQQIDISAKDDPTTLPAPTEETQENNTQTKETKKKNTQTKTKSQTKAEGDKNPKKKKTENLSVQNKNKLDETKENDQSEKPKKKAKTDKTSAVLELDYETDNFSSVEQVVNDFYVSEVMTRPMEKYVDDNILLSMPPSDYSPKPNTNVIVELKKWNEQKKLEENKREENYKNVERFMAHVVHRNRFPGNRADEISRFLFNGHFSIVDRIHSLKIIDQKFEYVACFLKFLYLYKEIGGAKSVEYFEQIANVSICVIYDMFVRDILETHHYEIYPLNEKKKVTMKDFESSRMELEKMRDIFEGTLDKLEVALASLRQMFIKWIDWGAWSLYETLLSQLDKSFHSDITEFMKTKSYVSKLNNIDELVKNANGKLSVLDMFDLTSHAWRLLSFMEFVRILAEAKVKSKEITVDYWRTSINTHYVPEVFLYDKITRISTMGTSGVYYSFDFDVIFKSFSAITVDLSVINGGKWELGDNVGFASNKMGGKDVGMFVIKYKKTENNPFEKPTTTKLGDNRFEFLEISHNVSIAYSKGFIPDVGVPIKVAVYETKADKSIAIVTNDIIEAKNNIFNEKTTHLISFLFEEAWIRWVLQVITGVEYTPDENAKSIFYTRDNKHRMYYSGDKCIFIQTLVVPSIKMLKRPSKNFSEDNTIEDICETTKEGVMYNRRHVDKKDIKIRKRLPGVDEKFIDNAMKDVKGNSVGEMNLEDLINYMSKHNEWNVLSHGPEKKYTTFYKIGIDLAEKSTGKNPEKDFRLRIYDPFYVVHPVVRNNHIQIINDDNDKSDKGQNFGEIQEITMDENE